MSTLRRRPSAGRARTRRWPALATSRSAGSARTPSSSPNARNPGAQGQVKEITSLANPLVKDIKALALKKFRDQQNAFLAEGLKLVIDALDLGWSIKTLVFAKAGIGNPAIEKVAARTVAAGGLVLEVGEKVLSAITRRDNPQTVVAVFAQK